MSAVNPSVGPGAQTCVHIAPPIPLKVVLLTRSLSAGGAERQLTLLAKGLAARGHQVTVVRFYAGGALENELANSAVAIRTLGKTGRWDTIRFLRRLVAILRAERPDVLHSYLVVSNLLTALLRPLLPATRLVWGVRASNVDLRYYDWLQRATFSLSCRASRFADKIIVNSTAGLLYHRDHGYPAEKMVVIPNGIDTNRFRPDSVVREKIRAEWGVEDDQVLIGLVARLDPMKDHGTFLEAASLLAKYRPHVRFVCVGDGPLSYARAIQARSERFGLSHLIIWAGARTDMPNMYNAFDISTSSSSFGEGFSNAIGEAMACGVPCVVTDVGDSAQIVGECGLIVPPRNAHAMTAAWESLLSSNVGARQAMGQAARDRVLSLYSVERLIDRTESVLLDCTEGV